MLYFLWVAQFFFNIIEIKDLEFFGFFSFHFIAIIDDLIFFIGIERGFGIRVFGQDIGVEQEEQEEEGED